MPIIRKTLLIAALLSTGLFAGIAVSGTVHAETSESAESLEIFEMVEMEIEGVIYEVQVRKNPPVLRPAETAYFY